MAACIDDRSMGDGKGGSLASNFRSRRLLDIIGHGSKIHRGPHDYFPPSICIVNSILVVKKRKPDWHRSVSRALLSRSSVLQSVATYSHGRRE